jgi:hypothetical protein
MLYELLSCDPPPFILYVTNTDENSRDTFLTMKQLLLGEFFDTPVPSIRHYMEGVDLSIVEANQDLILLSNSSAIAFVSIESEKRGRNILRRPSHIFCDDIVKTSARTSRSIREKAEYIYNAVIEKMGNEETRFFLSGTFIHPDDILLKLYKSGLYKTFVVDIHKAVPERFTEEYIAAEEEKHKVLRRMDIWNTEYLLNPILPQERPFFDFSVNFYDTIPDPQSSLYKIIGIDHSHCTGNDDFAIVAIACAPSKKIYVLDFWASAYASLQERKEAVKRFALKYKPQKIVIEANTDSRTFIDILREELRSMPFYLEEISPREHGKKEARILSILGEKLPRIYFRTDQHKIIEQIRNFDYSGSERDDLLDALTYAVLNERYLPEEKIARDEPKFLSHIRQTISGSQNPQEPIWEY